MTPGVRTTPPILLRTHSKKEHMSLFPTTPPIPRHVHLAGGRVTSTFRYSFDCLPLSSYPLKSVCLYLLKSSKYMGIPMVARSILHYMQVQHPSEHHLEDLNPLWASHCGQSSASKDISSFLPGQFSRKHLVLPRSTWCLHRCSTTTREHMRKSWAVKN